MPRKASELARVEMEASGDELEQEGNRIGDIEYKKKLHACLEPSLVSF